MGREQAKLEGVQGRRPCCVTWQGRIFPDPQEVQHEVTPVETGSGDDMAVEVHHLE